VETYIHYTIFIWGETGKSEIRSTKFETNSNDQNINDQNCLSEF